MAVGCLAHAQVEEDEALYYIAEYRVTGATRISALEVEKAVYPWLGPARSADDVEQARLALEQAFHRRGFQSVSVLIPQQDPRYGVIRLEVVEGKVGRLRVNGARYFRTSKIRAAVPSMAEGTVPDMNEVEREILALNRLPDRRVVPELAPGTEFGTVDITLTVEDELPLHGSFEVNNRFSPNTTELRLNAAISHANLFQLGHVAGLSCQIAPENTDDALVYSGFYLARLDPGPDLLFSATKQDSDVSTLGGGSVVGRGETYSLRAMFDLPHGTRFLQNFSLGLDAKFVDEDIKVAGSTLSAPVEYYPLSANYGARWVHEDESFTELNASLGVGLRGLGSDSAAFALKRYKGDGSFLVLRADASHTRDLNNGAQVFGKVQGQLADGPVVNTEQFSGGGLGSARGYLESTALGDNALFATAELRSRSFLGPVDRSDPRADEWRVHVFADAGVVAIYHALPGQPSSAGFASVGAGTRIRYRKHFASSVDVAIPLLEVAPVDPGDIRVTFRGWADF